MHDHINPGEDPLNSADPQLVNLTSEARSYRCSYHPKDLNGYPVVEDSGVLPYIQLKASNAEHAQRAAFAVTGCVVAGVERMEAGVA